MRIVYGVFGYGRGHATRALSVLPELAKQHELLVLAGGDAYEALSESFPVFQLPRMGYVYGSNGRHSLVGTVRANTAPVADALFDGPVAKSVRKAMESFRPHVAVSDAEPFTHHVAARLGIPRISFDHVGMLAHCKVHVPPRWRWAMARDVSTYLLLMGRPAAVIISSFFHVEPRHHQVRCVGPLLRREVKGIEPSDGKYLLAYFNRGRHQVSRTIEAELQRLGMPVVMYGSDTVGTRGNLHFQPASNEGFLRDLAAASAVVSTAGNQLVGECIHFKKPLLAIPENCLEQQVNAAAVRRLGIGHSVESRALNADVIHDFLSAREDHQTALHELAAERRPDALEALKDSLFSLAAARALPARRSWRYA